MDSAANDVVAESLGSRLELKEPKAGDRGGGRSVTLVSALKPETMSSEQISLLSCSAT